MNIREVAKLAGVSVSTVSRILNNKPDVNEETRQKVIQLMNEHHFLPSVAATSRKSIGIVTPAIAFPEFMGELLGGIMEVAYSLNESITLLPISQVDADDIMHYCRSNSLLGLIVINPPASSPLPGQLRAQGIPHVILAARLGDTDTSWVDVDNYGGARDAVSHLVQGGHRRIALIHGNRDYRCEDDRVRGYLDVLTEHRVPVDPTLLYENPMPASELTGIVSRMLQLDDPPTAFFATTHRETINLLGEFRRLGVAVPKQVSLVGFGDYEVSALTNPALTTVRQPIGEMGKAAVWAFQELIKQQQYEKKQVLLPTGLMIRDSTRSI